MSRNKELSDFFTIKYLDNQRAYGNVGMKAKVSQNHFCKLAGDFATDGFSFFEGALGIFGVSFPGGA
jgi:hypothetical protein